MAVTRAMVKTIEHRQIGAPGRARCGHVGGACAGGSSVRGTLGSVMGTWVVHVDQREGRCRKARPGPRGPEHGNSTCGRHHTRPVGEVRRTGPSKEGRLVRADQRARNLRNRRPGVPSGVPCGEGRIEDEAAGRIEGRAALVTPRNSCPGPATLHLACTPTNGVPSARPLSPNHWGEGSGSCHPKSFKMGGWRGRGKDGAVRSSVTVWYRVSLV